MILSDFGAGNWRSLAVIGYDERLLEEKFSRMIYWSPDSSWFVVPQEERDPVRQDTTRSGPII